MQMFKYLFLHSSFLSDSLPWQFHLLQPSRMPISASSMQLDYQDLLEIILSTRKSDTCLQGKVQWSYDLLLCFLYLMDHSFKLPIVQFLKIVISYFSTNSCFRIRYTSYFKMIRKSSFYTVIYYLLINLFLLHNPHPRICVLSFFNWLLERGRKRDIHMRENHWLVFSPMLPNQLGIKPTKWICALTGNLTCHLLV